MPPPPRVGGRAAHWLPCFTGEEAEAERGLATSLSSHRARTHRKPGTPLYLSISHSHTATDWGNLGTVAGAYGPELKTRAGREGHPGGRGSVPSCQLVTWPTAADRVGPSSRHPPPLPLPSLPSPSRASLRLEAQTRGYE